MAAKVHRFRLEARFGPADLLKALKSVCEDTRNRTSAPEFDFDWLKRRVAISASSACAAEELAERVELLVAKRGGKGLMLRGQRTAENARHTVPFGILLQTPDVYTEVIRDTLGELGVPVAMGEDGETFAITVNPAARMLDYLSIVRNFPLPEYLELIDEG